MSIANEITRLQTAKSNIKTALENKGVAVDSAATLDYYATYIDNIPSGGGNNALIKSIKIEDFTGTTFNRSTSYITSVTIPSTVTSISDYAFQNCSSLASITIPDSVRYIGNGAFYDCDSLTSVTIGNSVTSIGQEAFHNCKSLTSVTIPDSVTSISSYVFYKCSGLASITIGNSVTSIGTSSFDSCTSLTSVTIPDSVTSISSYAFYDCNKLASVTVNSTTPPTLGGNAFTNTNDCPIYVPAASLEAYKAATNWSTYADRLQAIPT